MVSSHPFSRSRSLGHTLNPRFGRILRMVMLLLLTVGTLLQPASQMMPPADQPNQSLAAIAAEQLATQDAGNLPPAAVAAVSASDPRPLPADVRDLAEVLPERTANTATFQKADGSFTSIIADAPLHYRDAQGAWQSINPMFQATPDSFLVQQNAIRSRAGTRTAWLSAEANAATLTWQATELGVVDADQRWTSLASALPESAQFAQRDAAGTRLHYAGGWSNPAISEQIDSAAGSLEHSLILHQRPAANGTPRFLDMQATLKLLPGATLWANNAPVNEATSAQTLEIRDQAGTTALVFDPVLAFEQANPDHTITGEYLVAASDQKDAWTVTVRTPWSWWADANRQYPAVLDPTMHVLKTTGYQTGLAWVANPQPFDFGNGVFGPPFNPDTSDNTFHFGKMVLGSFYKSTPYRGYMQFNSIPSMLTNAAISVTLAKLDVIPSGGRMPAYSFPEGDFPDWEEVYVQHDATLYALGQCPAQCNGFSLVNQPANFNWNSPIGNPTSLGKQPLKIPPTKTGGDLTTTSWDVTTQIRTWNQQVPRPANGPMFMLKLNTKCTKSTFGDDDGAFVPACTRFVVPKGNVQLRIDYAAVPMDVSGASSNLLNRPGVPSYLEDVFAEGTTNHQYDLNDGGSARWRAIAVRGNHRLNDPSPTATKTGLLISDYTDAVNPKPLMSNIGTLGLDETSFAVIDRHNAASQISSRDLKVEVTASDQNNFATDEKRNYRVQYTEATAWGTPVNGDWITKTILLSSASLMSLGEFNVQKGDNVGLRITTPAAANVDLALLQPTTGNNPATALVSNSQVDSSFGPGNVIGSQRQYTKPPFPASRTGAWGIAVINQGRPTSVEPRPNDPTNIFVQVEIKVCPQGSIPTAKWKLCQPVRLASGNEDVLTKIRTVGSLTIYSEGGFTLPQGQNWCTTNEGFGTPSIKASGPIERWTVIGQGKLCVNGSTLATSADSGVGLAYRIFPDLVAGDWRGEMPPALLYGDTMAITPPANATGVMQTNAQNRLLPNANTRRNINPFGPLWGSVLNEPAGSHYIGLPDMIAFGGGTINADVIVDQAAGATNLGWNVPWTLFPTAAIPDSQATDAAYQFDVVLSQTPALPSPANIASLELRILDGSNNAIGKLLTLDAVKLGTNIYATQFRGQKAKITQPVSLGGATKNVQVVVQPPGMARLPLNQETCESNNLPASCLDLRLDTYQWGNGFGDKNVALWELPDVHIADNVGMMAFSRAGSTQIWSADHPDAAQDVNESFSFDTWGASVTIREEACFPGEALSTVVNGTASIALPMFGDDGSEGNAPTEAPSIMVGFRLCESKLYSATLALNIKPVLIPVGASGLGVNFIQGTVLLNPEYTTIEFKLGFETTDGSTLTDGMGIVTIDTRGMFSLEANATIIGILDAHLFLQVAWNPLDVLLDASVKYGGDLVTGSLHIHAWVGQGWQNKYSWLPDDDALHFSGKIAATLKIEQGYIGDIGITKLPPSDIIIGLQISIGEFCTNPTCSTYDWGLSVALTIAGFNIGLYVDSEGPEFIFGTDDHVLIDQFNGVAQKSSAQAKFVPLPNQIIQPGNQQKWLTPAVRSSVDGWTAIDPAAAGCSSDTAAHTATCPFTVKPGTGKALWMAGWQNGALDVALITPDGTVITPTNALANGVTMAISDTAETHQVMFGVNPISGQTIQNGVWQVRLSNVGQGLLPGIENNYQLVYAADPPAPTINWLAPATAVSPNGAGIVSLDWQVLRDTTPVTPGMKIELAYEPIATKPITPTEYAGILIANQLPASAGHYDWNTNGLVSGEYAVVARVDDHFKGNGSVVAWALGTVVINDTVAPPIPTAKQPTTVKDGLIVRWNRDLVTRDLAGYLVEYTIPQWHEGVQLTKQRRVLPSGTDSGQWLNFEAIRLGGLLDGQPVTVCVHAYDASGNISGCVPFTMTLPTSNRGPVGPVQRVNVTVAPAPAALPVPMFQVNWSAPLGGGASGYLLSYKPIGCILPAVERIALEGRSPIDVGNVLTANLRDLTPGQLYRVGVRAYDNELNVSAELTDSAVFVLATDSNGDGLSDQWATVYGITSPTADSDGDGLSNLAEYQGGSNPNKADSDGDGYYDSEETAAGTGLCSPEHPAFHVRPRLTVIGKSLLKFTLATNGGGMPNIQKFSIHNLGGGEMNWTADPSAAWIKLDKTSGIDTDLIEITADGTGMSPGVYGGTVTIIAVNNVQKGGTGEPQPETVVINVEMTVLPTAQRMLYLPMITR